MYLIEELVAHRQPMLLISRLVEYDEKKACCEVDITENSVFYQQDIKGVASYVGIEYMAQAIAAFAGAKARDIGQDIKIGFLLGSRKFETYTNHFQAGKSYRICVEELYKEDKGLSVFQCMIFDKENLLAKAKINVFQPENSEVFLKEQ